MITDKKEARIRIRDYAVDFNECSEALKNDRDFVLDLAKIVGMVLEYVKSDFQDDEEIVFAAVKEYSSAMQFASDRLKDDKEFTSQLVGEGCYVLHGISSSLKDDESIVLPHVQKWGISLRHASDRLRGNLDIIKAAMMQDKNAIEYAIFDDLDRETCIQTLIEVDPFVELHFGKNDDEDFVLDSIRKTTDAFLNASERLKKSRDFVMAAVKVDGLVLEYTGEFKKDKFIVLRAGQQNPRAFEYLSAELSKDRDIAIARVENNPRSIGKLDEELYRDEGIAVAAARVDGSVTLEVSPLDCNERVVMTAVKQNGAALRHARGGTRDIEDIVLAAVANYKDAILYASERLRKDPDFMEKVSKISNPTEVSEATIFKLDENTEANLNTATIRNPKDL